ncbi:ATP-binding protein [Tellurirhabdus bombi]|uniref:ATP-binding protein n=1 Tax=Tellurirhabdus bombi TaxID=2907205 RepID=UPI001F439592|nr:ATP-binding protein [Tellurirhabdus bombi]
MISSNLSSLIDHSPVDITACDREPIHILGHIQSHGHLVAITPDTYQIKYVSERIAELVGLTPDAVLGQSIDYFLSQTDLGSSSLKEILNIGLRNGTWETLNPHRLRLNGTDWNLITHQHNNLILLEWEPLNTDTGTALVQQQLIAEALTEVQSSKTLTDLLQNTARRIKAIIGYDRVMVYRFDADWHGHVIAEAKDDHLEPYLGLHYPASDIPKQARELYKLNLIRIIADAGSKPAALLTARTENEAAPLDLTHSVLRAVSPVHIEYLKNMGVQASMSISLLYRGELWGLISCHNSTPRFVDYASRQAAKFVSQLLSAALEFRKDEEDNTLLRKLQQHEHSLYNYTLSDWDVVSGLTRHDVTALDVTTATGAVLIYEDKIHRMGQTPDDKEINGLVQWINTLPFDTFWSTNQLPNLCPGADAYREVAAGLLVIALSRELNEYVLWFKPERIRQVTWAGNPEKPVTQEDGQARISPRKSFDAWTQTVRNTSESWSEAEISTVIKLREDVLQVVSRKANEVRVLNERLRVAYEELDAFSYTVSHDLRTPLSSIRCYSEIILEEYGADFNDDARALFDKIMLSTDRMRALIRHILYYSRMGRIELSATPIPMNELLNSIREEILINEKDRNLTIDIGDVPLLHGDKTMITQLFANLLSNAAKYTRPVEKAVIKVTGYETDQEMVYCVQDNGIGFDMKQAGMMFDLFRRLENAREFEGTGVGLAIVKRIVGRHDGKIWFHSEPNRETSFWISFPRLN